MKKIRKARVADTGALIATYAPTKVMEVEAQTLRVHPTAQRRLVELWVRQIEDELDLDKIGIISVVECEIDGVWGLWIVDGQHRWTALKNQGLGEWVVKVHVYTGKHATPAGASALFLMLNKGRHPPKAIDDFVQSQRAGVPDAVGASQIVEDHELTLSQDGNASGGVIRCAALLRTVFRYDEGATLTATLDTVIGAWGRTDIALEGKVIDGLSLLYKRCDGAIDRADLVRKLAKYPGGPSHLIGDARGLRQYNKGSLARCVAQCVADYYNKGRRINRLEPF